MWCHHVCAGVLRRPSIVVGSARLPLPVVLPVLVVLAAIPVVAVALLVVIVVVVLLLLGEPHLGALGTDHRPPAAQQPAQQSAQDR